MKQRAAELKAEKNRADGRKTLLDAIAAMSGSDRAIAERLDAIVTEVAPQLAPKTWYGFPAYTRDGKVVVFFKPAEKFGDRYATIGFETSAQLDDGQLWPTSYAVLSLEGADAERVAELVRRAAG